MTADEADRIIAELNIVFPNKKLNVEEVLRWEANLAPFSVESARETVRLVEQSMKFWPTWADFKEIIVPIHKREQIAAQQLALQSAEAPCTPEETREHIARIREMMKNKGFWSNE